MSPIRMKTALTTFITASTVVLAACSNDKKDPEANQFGAPQAGPEIAPVQRPVSSENDKTQILSDEAPYVQEAEDGRHSLRTTMLEVDKTTSQSENYTLSSHAISVSIDHDDK